MSEEMLKALVTQIPDLVALIILVTIFLKHISKKSAEQQALLDKAIEVIEHNSVVMGQVVEAMHECGFRSSQVTSKR